MTDEDRPNRYNPMTPEQSRKLDKLGMLILAAVVMAAGVALGRVSKKWEFQADAKKQGYAWHNRDTGAWQWKTPEEYEIVKLNSDPLKLEAAFRAMALPVDGKILAEELTAPKPTTKKESHE